MASATARFSVAPDVLDRLGAAMQPIDGDSVFNMVRDSKVVLIGESRRVKHSRMSHDSSTSGLTPRPVCSHGTDEFYRARPALITRSRHLAASDARISYQAGAAT
jgi:hypothetical protein